MPASKIRPLWTLILPLVSLTAMIAGNPKHRLWAAFLAAIVYAAMQWALPKCRFRPDNYFSPINIAMALMLLKLVAVPSLIMLVGPETPILTWLPPLTSMNNALLIDIVAYVALCLGLTFAPDELTVTKFSLPTPNTAIIVAYMMIGSIGFIAVFGSFGRLVQYFTEPGLVSEIANEQPATVSGFIGTFLRPFLAFSVIAWWTRLVDQDRPVWIATLAGLFGSIIITMANLTYSFNRAAFVFPLLSLMAVYHNRIRRIPLLAMAVAASIALPTLMLIFTYRSNLMVGAETNASTALEEVAGKINENLQGYAVGPEYTGIFYDKIGWGDHLYFGATLLSSALSPVPVLGKNFRENNGPALFNHALYGIGGIEDQILPFNAELFANFHGFGVVAGYIALGFLIGKLDQWILGAGSSFTAFALQYAGIWTALLTTWSLSIYSQILLYFFWPVYLYIALAHLRQWLRRAARHSRTIRLNLEATQLI